MIPVGDRIEAILVLDRQGIAIEVDPSAAIVRIVSPSGVVIDEMHYDWFRGFFSKSIALHSMYDALVINWDHEKQRVQVPAPEVVDGRSEAQK